MASKAKQKGTGGGSSPDEEYRIDLDASDYRGLEAVRLDIGVDDSLVEERFNELLQAVSCKEIDDPIEDGDEVSYRVESVRTPGGDALAAAGRTETMTVGAGAYVAGFEASFIGRRRGDGFTATLCLPYPYMLPSWEGCEVAVTVEVAMVRRHHPFEATDSYVSSVSEFESADALREAIARQYALEAEGESQRLVYAQLAGQLADAARSKMDEGRLLAYALRLEGKGQEEGKSLSAEERRRITDEAAFDAAWRSIARNEGLEGAGSESDVVDAVMALVLNAASISGATAPDDDGTAKETGERS